MERIVLHINIVNFFVAVARAAAPRLASYPVAIATVGATRRVVLDHSTQARAAGIYRGMLLDRAKRICPDLIVLTPTPEIYDRAIAAVTNETLRLSPRVEPAGPGHLFADLTGTERLLGCSVDCAETLRRRLREKFRLDATIGLSTSKLVSKVATRVVKPLGLCRVIRGCEEEFLAPLPLSLLPGIDAVALRKMLQFNIKIISDLHVVSREMLSDALGATAHEIFKLAHGIDTTPVREAQAAAPLVHERWTFSEQTNDDRIIANALFGLISNTGKKLREIGVAAGRIRIQITYSDGMRRHRERSLMPPLSGDLSLYEIAAKLLWQAYQRRIRLTGMAVTFSELSFPYGQLDLFRETSQESNLMQALDGIRNSYGNRAIMFWGRDAVMRPYH